jgi:hypothetical protein
MEARGLRYGLVVVALVASAAIFAAVASAKDTTTSQPALTLQRDCETFGQGVNGIEASLSGFPPFTSFDAIIKFPDGGQIGPRGSGLETDANGNYGPHGLGTEARGTWTVTVIWSGGTLTKSLYVNCKRPATRRDCTNGGWTKYGFRNQSHCVAWVRRHRPS